jgi:hydrogenase maturation protease
VTDDVPQPTVRIVVCGNADRGDDGVAFEAVAKVLTTLPRTLLRQLEVDRCQELCVEDLVDLPAGVSCLIVDAVAGVEPGSVVRLPLTDLAARPPFTPRSSHQLPIDLVLGLAGILRDGPITGTFVGLAGHGFGYGKPLSGAARAAMPAFSEAIEEELCHLA